MAARDIKLTAPCDTGAEAAFLGAMLLNQDAFIEGMEKVGEADAFYDPKNQRIFAAMKALYESRKGLDAITLAGQLDRDGTLDDAGGYEYVASLLNAVPTSAHVAGYADIILDKWKLRRFIDLMLPLIRESNNGIENASGFVQNAATSLTQLAISVSPLQRYAPHDLMKQHQAWLHRIKDNRAKYAMSTGIAELDEMTQGGIEPGKLAVIAAQSSVGKSSLLGCLAINFAAKGRRGLIITAETSKTEIMRRLNHALCPPGRFMDAYEKKRWREIYDLMRMVEPELYSLPIHIYDESNYIEDIMLIARRQVRDHPDTAWIGIDYFQVLGSRSNNKYDPRGGTALAEYIMQKIVEMKKEFPGVALIVLSQFAKRDQARRKEKHTREDLKNTSRLDSDADLIFLLHPSNSKGDRRAVEVELAKNRDGPQGSRTIDFLAPMTLFLGKGNGVNREVRPMKRPVAPENEDNLF